MKTVVPSQKTVQKITLIDGFFTPSDAKDVMIALLNEKINFHKVKRLSITEGNIEDDCLYDSNRIDELIEAKQNAIDFFNQLDTSDSFLEIDSTIEIKVKQKSELN